ncbi:alpha/beta fold hydrolase [Myxococcus sp. 1LA]
MFGEKWFYILYFQEPGVAEAEFEADVTKSVRTILTGTPGFDVTNAAVLAKKKGDGFLKGLDVPEALPSWLSEADVAYFAKELAGSGFRGGLNRYRNMDRDWHELPELATATIQQPALYLVGEKDPVRGFSPVEPMKALVPNLADIQVIPGAGHWVQQERAEEVNASLVAFLKTLPA